MKKKLLLIFFALIVFLTSCQNDSTILLSSNSQKESPSTILTVELPRRSGKEDTVTVLLGIGLRMYSQYDDRYIDTILTVEGEEIVVNDCNDVYKCSIDITAEEYRATKKNIPLYYIEIPINFKNCSKSSGTLTISLISYFEKNERNGMSYTIKYVIKNDTVRFSAN